MNELELGIWNRILKYVASVAGKGRPKAASLAFIHIYLLSAISVTKPDPPAVLRLLFPWRYDYIIPHSSIR